MLEIAAIIPFLRIVIHRARRMGRSPKSLVRLLTIRPGLLRLMFVFEKRFDKNII
jgi:hypothetical protein